jgi:hypothetical protein
MALLTNSGSLVSGTYQFTYRFIRHEEYSTSSNNYYDYRESKWVLPTAPVFIADKIDNLAAGDGQIGRASDNRIRLEINMSSDERLYYTHYQVAVLRRLDGQHLSPTEAFKFEAIPISGVQFPDTFEVGSNYEYVEIDIADILIDNAPINYSKTIEEKNNILFTGNISYYDRDIPDTWTFNATGVDNVVKSVGLSYDPAQPAGLQGYSDSLVSHRYVSHFRDEVYRYGITYVDKYGNFSPVKVFNFNTSTNNSIQDSQAIDWRYPTRDTDGYTLFDSDSNIQALGLSIPSIDNHPTWAVGFSIVRAKRKENIKFQTPLIPLSQVQPAIANNDPDPEQKFPKADGDTLADPNGTLMPKDFRRWNVTQSSTRVAAGSSGNWENQTVDDPETFVHMVFPTSMMYQNGTDVIDVFNDNSIKSLKIVDSVGLKFHTGDFTSEPSGNTAGEGKYRNETHTLYATTNDQYYYEDGQTGKTKINTITGFDHQDIRVLEFGYMENFAQEYTLRTSVEDLTAPSVGGFESMRMSTSNDTKPDNMRAGIVVTNKGLRDPSYETLTSAGDIEYDYNGTAGAGVGISSADPSSDTADTDIISSLLVVNATADLSDSRYGDETDYNEFIPVQFEKNGSNKLSTVYLFTATELSSVASASSVPISVDVWGGDCFISRHNFKISNGTLRLTNDDGITYSATGDLTQYWGAEFEVWETEFTAAYGMPVGVDGYSQIIQLFLESKINGDVIQRDSCQTAGSNLSLIENSSFEIRIPFDYNYMLSYSMENANKVFFSDNILDRDTNKYESRILYSKTKILNTDVEGFDEFPVNNIYDLENKYGSLTKLIHFRNRMYGIQQDAVTYIPVQARVIETDVTTNQLAVRSANIIDLHQSVSTTFGSQHINSVITSDLALFFIDAERKKIVSFSDSTAMISEQNMATYFNNNLSTNISEGDLRLAYDLVNYKLITGRKYNGSESWSIVWNDKFKVWESELDTASDSDPMAYVQSNDDLYVMGLDYNGNLAIYKMYDSTDSTFMGKTFIPSVTYISVPKEGFPSTFDTLTVDSSGKMKDVKMTVYRDSDVNDYYTNNMSLSIQPTEGVYKIKTLRNINPDNNSRSGQRLRGSYVESFMRWDETSNEIISLSSVATKYRPSRRQI